jgi:hypothetical protein
VALRDAGWRTRWTNTYEWSRFMIYGDNNVNNSVVHATANKLNLIRYGGEPLRLDAVFSESRELWFPMIVALEHENSPYTFNSEIWSLLSVRVPLKVGINYALRDPRSPQDAVIESIRSAIARQFELIDNVTREDSRSEYFLIGREGLEYELEWLSLAFTAGRGPRNVDFI